MQEVDHIYLLGLCIDVIFHLLYGHKESIPHMKKKTFNQKENTRSKPNGSLSGIVDKILLKEIDFKNTKIVN